MFFRWVPNLNRIAITNRDPIQGALCKILCGSFTLNPQSRVFYINTGWKFYTKPPHQRLLIASSPFSSTAAAMTSPFRPPSSRERVTESASYECSPIQTPPAIDTILRAKPGASNRLSHSPMVASAGSETRSTMTFCECEAPFDGTSVTSSPVGGTAAASTTYGGDAAAR
ncbi:hypothetical protein C2845_PM15G15650 [Panicum miliaceum]|uniref:Uncharacterized protein n=1 Tax=Panicum miliaceum TaxID=4540 RepID=A0A3L6QAP6_PANMI|nr:hypothetical protein C2845_PM15G15650 [Panicum miliaceum]